MPIETVFDLELPPVSYGHFLTIKPESLKDQLVWWYGKRVSWNELGIQSGEAAYRAIVERVGVEPGTILGSGRYGVAYSLPDGRILKLTSDKTEIRSMAILRGAIHPSLIRVHDVFVVQQKAADTKILNFGIIVRDAIETTVAQVPELELLSRHLRNAGMKADEVFMAKSMMPAIARYLEKLLNNINGFPHEMQVIAWDVARGINALKDLGVLTFDFGGGNVGLVGIHGVLFDIGSAEFTKKAPPAPIDVLVLH